MNHPESGDRSVIEFLRENKLYAPDIDMGACCEAFHSEMRKGLAGEPGSLRMIPTYIEAEGEVPAGTPVIAIDAGGTFFRVAVIVFDASRQPRFLHFSKHPMPGLNAAVSKDAFFDLIADFIREHIDGSDHIGFSIAYPTEILPNKDGRLIQFCKEVQAPEIEGELIGENLNRVLTSMHGGSAKRVIMLNDTVATLLAGRSAARGARFDSYIGFILGTGTNCCYIEANKNILKCPGLDPLRHQIINVESGAFGLAPRGALDIRVDEASVDPGSYKFEKMLSGGYLGLLCLQVLKSAAEEYHLFSSVATRWLDAMPILTTEDIDAFLRQPAQSLSPLTSVCQASEQDRITTMSILDAVIDRAAKLTAVNIAATVLQCGQGTDPAAPVAVTVDGTTFFQMQSLRERVEHYLDGFLVEAHGVHYNILHVPDGTIIGAAIAGLTN